MGGMALVLYFLFCDVFERKIILTACLLDVSGCTAMYLLVKGHGSELYQDKLVAAGACEAVAKALVKFSEVCPLWLSSASTLISDVFLRWRPWLMPAVGLWWCYC